MKIHKYEKKKDYSDHYIYKRWNYTTACCFKYKTKCVLCPNQIVCAGFKKEGQMHPMKYATMMTYRNIGTKFKENGCTRIAKWIVRYQNFCINAAINNAPEGYSKSTLRNYMTYGLQYLKHGKKIKLYNWLYPYLDEVTKQHLQPLTPSIGERKRERTNDYTAKDNTPPVAKLACVTNPITAKIQYGIRFEDTIKIFQNEEEATWFNKGIEFVKGEPGKIVTVELGEV